MTVHRPGLTTDESSPCPPVAISGVAWVLSLVALALTILAAAGGLWIDDLYQDSENVTAALRGADLATLVVGAPLLAVAVFAVRRSSHRMATSWSMRVQLIWLAMLAYLVYGYAYYVFGPTFNDLFLIHVAIMSVSATGLVVGLASFDPSRMTTRIRSAWALRAISAFLIVTAGFLVVTYGLATVRHASGGDLPQDVLPFAEWRVHLGYALDLSILAPSMIVAGVGLWRVERWGHAAATVVSVGMAVYQTNFLASAVFMDDAGIDDAASAVPQAMSAIVILAIPAIVLVWGASAAPTE